jgi:hypothetical protein
MWSGAVSQGLFVWVDFIEPCLGFRTNNFFGELTFSMTVIPVEDRLSLLLGLASFDFEVSESMS